MFECHSPSRFFMVTKMIEGWQRVDWTGWCRLSLSACCHMTSRMASTFDLRSWAVGMVRRYFNAALLVLHDFVYKCDS